MKVLLVGMGNRVFMPDLRKQLQHENIEAEMLDFLMGCYVDSEGKTLEFGKKITSKNFIKKNLQLIVNFRKAMQLIHKKSYDVCNIHFLDVRYYFFKRKLLKLADKLVVSTYGSDFYKYNNYSFLQRTFYNKASCLTFTNEKTLESFDNYYDKKYLSKLYTCRFGLSILAKMGEYKNALDFRIEAKNEFNLQLNKIILTVGYHSNPITQHVPILNEILKLPDKLKNRIIIVLPMAYGGFVDQIKRVEDLLNNSNLSFVIIKDFLSVEKIIKLRFASDIMVNMPSSDQLSATMCEYLYSQNWVITGKWLPYESIDNTGVNYERIDSIEQLSERLKDVVENFDDYKKLTLQNPDKIWNFSSWEQNIKQWIDVYSA